MKKENRMIIMVLLLALVVNIMISNSAVAQDQEAIQEANEALQEFYERDEGIKKLVTGAYGYAVYPSVGKGGAVVGGAHGDGIVYEKGTPIGGSTLTQVDVGFQLGGQKYRELVLFENESAFKNFIEGKFKLSAQATAVAVSKGASADAAYRDHVMIFTMAVGGLMFEAAVGGQKFKFKTWEELEQKKKDKDN